jgi:hypothetical protein
MGQLITIEIHDSPTRDSELWDAIHRLEEQRMTDQAEVDALTTQVTQVGADLAAAKTTLQQEIDALAAANPGINLSGLQAAVTPLDTAAKALAELKPEPTAPTKAVYTHVGEAAINSSWTPSGFETVPAEGATPEPLYYFSGDSEPGETNGAGAEWTVYTGATQPVPAAS